MGRMSEEIEELENQLVCAEGEIEELNDKVHELEGEISDMQIHMDFIDWCDKAYPNIINALDKRYRAVKDTEVV
jgi:prefoldin subunit 5